MYIKYLLLTLLIATHAIASSIAPAEEKEMAAAAAERPNKGLLVFLDDTETTMIGPISAGLIQAVQQEAGPIIASASLIQNIRGDRIEPAINDPKRLFARYQEIRKQLMESADDSDLRIMCAKAELEDFMKLDALQVLGVFNQTIADRWVIKKISAALYLLLPKKYLASEGIAFQDVDTISAGPITEFEHKLGLKINHFKTVQVDHIKRPEPAPPVADYFVNALEKIFVTNQEYRHQSKYPIPQWGICIGGHGAMASIIVYLSIEQFKACLNFFETKITTRTLIYGSCYTGGLTAEKIYADSEKGITKNYPFAIVSRALTDVTTTSLFPEVEASETDLTLHMPARFDELMTSLAQSGPQNFGDLMATIGSKITEKHGVRNIPAVKLPGLPWFSVIDANNKTISIGAVMAKSRTQPLDIASYFARRGAEAEPAALLLYANDVPFELAINTQKMPAIISMVSGNALHRLRKITSADLTTQEILKGFNVEAIEPNKQFMIDTIEAAPDNTQVALFDSIDDVIISTAGKKFKTYFKHRGKLYSDLLPATAEQKIQYQQLLQWQKAVAIPIEFNFTQKQMERPFFGPLEIAQAEKELKKTFDAMPNNSVMRLPKLKLSVTKLQAYLSMVGLHPAFSAFEKLIKRYSLLYKKKLLIIDLIESGYKTWNSTYLLGFRTSGPQTVQSPPVHDVVFAMTLSGLSIYLNSNGKRWQLTKQGAKQLNYDYMPQMRAIFLKYASNDTTECQLLPEGVERQATQQLLTPEAMAKIRETVKLQEDRLGGKGTTAR